MAEKKMTAEDLAALYVAGGLPVPEHLEGLVARYRELGALIDGLLCYPKWVDKQMDACFDKIVEYAERRKA